MFAYKANAEPVMDRLRRLYARQAQDRIFATFAVPNAALDAFGRAHEKGFCD